MFVSVVSQQPYRTPGWAVWSAVLLASSPGWGSTCEGVLFLFRSLSGAEVPVLCLFFCPTRLQVFLGNSAGKESAWNAGDPGLIPRLGRSPGEGIGYPLQYPWASLVTQTVKNPPAIWEICGRSLGWEDPLEKGMATHSSIVAWRIPWTEEPGRLQSWGLKSRTWLSY